MILVDFSQVVISAITAEMRKTGVGTVNTVDEDYIRHVVSNMLRSYKQTHSSYGKMVLCCDGRGYWRREIFPNYKSGRNKVREESGIDWDAIYTCMNVIIAEIDEFYPYPIIHLQGVEGDDILFTLTEYLQENEFTKKGLFENPQDIVILSGDGDIVQTQVFKNVKQWDVLKKRWLTPDLPIEQFIIDHIVTGDRGDYIPSVLSPDNVFVDGIRQKPLSAKRKQEFHVKGIEACQNEDERKHYIRNEKIIDLRKIPQEIKDKIITQYKEKSAICNERGRSKLLNFFMKKKMKLLTECLSEF